MGSSISFYCGKEDNLALEEQAKALGLFVVPMRLDREVPADPAQRPFCYLSLLPPEQLHPYGMPAVNVSEATDPMIELLRSYYLHPHLVSGRLYWSDDIKPLAALTKKPYTQLARWIRSNWRKLDGSSFFFGPEAERLVKDLVAIPVTFAPDMSVEQR
jgi:hypothetical protein